jgi:hypothetical protein
MLEEYRDRFLENYGFSRLGLFNIGGSALRRANADVSTSIWCRSSVSARDLCICF